MANELITPDIIAKEGLVLLDNELVMSKLVYRDYESEFGETKVGSKIRIRRPVQYTIRTGSTAQVQDTTEGTVEITVDKIAGVDMDFPSDALTLTIDEFSERYLKPAMVQIANEIDVAVHTAAYQGAYFWRGTPGNTIGNWSEFSEGPKWLDKVAVPYPRCAVLSPDDHWSLAGAFTALPSEMGKVNRSALEQAKLPMTAGVDMYMTQNVVNHTVGGHAGTPAVDGANQNVAYAGTAASAVTARTEWKQTLITDGWTGSGVLKAGDVFTIANVKAVNPRTKAVLAEDQQFVILEDVTLPNSGTTDVELTISPPIITSGPYQTVNSVPADDALITYVGTAGASYAQNLVMHKNAIALTMVPLVLPPGAVNPSRQTYKGASIRVIPVYDGINDTSMWRLDVLYGTKAIDPRLITRLSGA